MKTFAMRQGTPEWTAARLGVVTASEMDALVSPDGKIRTGKGVNTYLCRKLCEKLLGFASTGGSFATEQGSMFENEARPWYEFTYGVSVQTVGFLTTDDGSIGASPDGLVGEDGGLEIKCFQPEHSLEVYLSGEVPKEHVIQIQTALWISRRAWWDFVSYSRQWPPLVIRVAPDLELHAAIDGATNAFRAKFNDAYKKISDIKKAEREKSDALYYATDPDAIAWAKKQAQVKSAPAEGVAS